MHENSFGLLEEKVLKAVSVIEELREGNRRLEAQLNDSEARFAEKKDECDQLQRTLEEARAGLQSVDELEQKRRTIEEKVGGLLSKLDSIG